jgi:hypothetical protein
MHASAPRQAPQVRVAGFDQIAQLQNQLAASGCAIPGFQGQQFPGMQAQLQQGIAAGVASFPSPSANGVPYGPNSIQNNCAMWPGGPKPLRSTYIGGTFPAFAAGDQAPMSFDVVTRNNWFLGFKFMAPDSLMGTGLGLSNLKINGMDYLDVVTPVPLEVFNALSDNETQGRIDLAWLQTPNGTATVTVQPVSGGAQGDTTVSLVCLQGFALANS